MKGMLALRALSQEEGLSDVLSEVRECQEGGREKKKENVHFPSPSPGTPPAWSEKAGCGPPEGVFPHLAPRAGSLHSWCWTGQMELETGDLEPTNSSRGG